MKVVGRRWAGALLSLAVAVLLLAGCVPRTEPTPAWDSIISGWVTDGRGGPAVEGATVTAAGIAGVMATTDAEGRFSLTVPAGTYDIIVTKAGYGSTRVQDVTVSKDQPAEILAIQQKAANKDWRTTPPRLRVSGLSRGASVSGWVDYRVEVVDAANPVYFIYVRYEKIGENSRDVRYDNTSVVSARWDVSGYPSGDSFINFTAYDINRNAVMLTIPVKVQNNWKGDKPGKVEGVNALALTLDEDFGIYSRRLSAANFVAKTGNVLGVSERAMAKLSRSAMINAAGTISPTVTPANSALVVGLDWQAVPGATGYRVYRSDDGGTTYKEVGYASGSYRTFILVKGRFHDSSPLLTPGKGYYYKVTAINGAGEGEASDPIMVSPLPPLRPTLKTPAHGQADVALTPTFTWGTAYKPFVRDPSTPSVFDEYREYEVFALELGGDFAFDDYAVNSEEYTPVDALKPATNYEWDIYYGLAWRQYDEQANSAAISYAYDGALNGAFTFTTAAQ